MDTAYLKELDITENESKVFISLLRLKKSHAGEIANKIGLHRKTIYDCLRRLEEKGLVGRFIENNINYYKAVNPKRLIEIIKEKQTELKTKEEKIRNVLPELISLYKTNEDTINAVIYNGKKGLISVMEDILHSKPKEWLSLISTGKAPETLPKYLPIFHKKRIKNKIKYKAIFYSNKKAEKRAKEHAKMALTQVRCIFQQAFMPISVWVYNNKVAFMVWENELGILIEGKKISDSFRQHFYSLWKNAKII